MVTSDDFPPTPNMLGGGFFPSGDGGGGGGGGKQADKNDHGSDDDEDWDFFDDGVETEVPLNDSADLDVNRAGRRPFASLAVSSPSGTKKVLPADERGEDDTKASSGEPAVMLPSLTRQDVETNVGPLGVGRFSEAYEVSKIRWPSAASDTAESPRRTAPSHGRQRYALKVLRDGLEDEGDVEAARTGAAYLSREAEVLKFLQSGGGNGVRRSGGHANIVRLFGVGEDVGDGGWANGSYSDGRDGEGLALLSGPARPPSTFLVLELLARDTLSDRIAAWRDEEKQYRKGVRPLKSPASCRTECRLRLTDRLGTVALDVARGLRYLQVRDVAHRDIKPENVGFDVRTGAAKIFDFGFARKFDKKNGDNDGEEERKPTALIGSLRYMAPEVARGRRYGPKVDVYSFGILLWEMCALDKAYKNYDVRQLHDKVIWGTVRPKLDNIHGVVEYEWPERLKDLMRRCWSENASDRPHMGYAVGMLTALVRDGGEGEWDDCDATSGGGGRRLSGVIRRIGSTGVMSSLGSQVSLSGSIASVGGGGGGGGGGVETGGMATGGMRRRRSSIKKQAGNGLKRTLSSASNMKRTFSSMF